MNWFITPPARSKLTLGLGSMIALLATDLQVANGQTLQNATLNAITEGPPAAVAEPSPEIARMKNLSLEQLLDEPVTTVSRSAGTVADSAAAVFVITHEDIMRSGVTNIPEALRMVP